MFKNRQKWPASVVKNKENLNSIIELNKKVDGYQKSLSEKEEIIQKLTSQADKSRHTLVVYYQKSLIKVILEFVSNTIKAKKGYRQIEERFLCTKI